MAEEITVDFSEEGRHGYRKFILKILNKAKDGRRRTHDIPVLPVKPQEGEHIEDFDVKLQLGGNYTLIVRIRRYDLYVIGYQMQNGQWFEFDSSDGIRLIPDSQFLGFTENYSEMGGLNDPQLRVGYSSIRAVIKQLSTGEDVGQPKSQMRLLCVMLSEATRFKCLLDKFDECIQERCDAPFEPWMELLVHNWGKLSRRMLRDDAFAQGSFLLPEEKGKDGKGGLNQLSESPLYIQNVDHTKRYLGILLGDYPNPPSNQEFYATLGLRVCRR